MGKSTAISKTKAFIKAIRKRRKDYIKFPIGPADSKKNIDDFEGLTKFPNVMGAVDGCHIGIRAPRDNAADYFHRNRYYSLVLQGVVDANQKNSFI